MDNLINLCSQHVALAATEANAAYLAIILNTKVDDAAIGIQERVDILLDMLVYNGLDGILGILEALGFMLAILVKRNHFVEKVSITHLAWHSHRLDRFLNWFTLWMLREGFSRKPANPKGCFAKARLRISVNQNGSRSSNRMYSARRSRP